MNGTIIWNEMENGLVTPVCRSSGLELEMRTKTYLIDVDISYDYPEQILSIFGEDNVEGYSLLDMSRLIISKDKRQDIDTHISPLIPNTNLAFRLVATINYLISSIREHKIGEEEIFGPGLKNKYLKDRDLLESVIKHYWDTYNKNGYDKNSSMSISFNFPFVPKGNNSIIEAKNEISNLLLVKSCMDCLNDIEFFTRSFTFDFMKAEIAIKISITTGLYAFLRNPSHSWSMAKKKNIHVYKVIHDLFFHADVEVGIDSIRKWINPTS